MKTKILTIIISFIFLFNIYSNIVYAVTSEMVNCDEIIANNTETQIDTEEKKEENLEITQMDETVKNGVYQGEVCIDTPAYAQVLQRPDADKIKVRGWAVSNDEKSTARILIDGKVVCDNLERHQRTDVDRIVSPSYGGTSLTPKAGFSGVIDISQLNAGTHKLRLEEVSRYGEVIAFHEIIINITNQKYQGEVCIDTPVYDQTLQRPDADKIEVRGWAVSNDEKSTARILVDGKVVCDNLERHQRTDVDRIVSPSYGGTSLTPKAGFSGVIDISQLNAGTHKLRLEEISRYGEAIACHEITIHVVNQRYQGEVCIDTPVYDQTLQRPDADKIEVRGWAVSNDEKSMARILVDGKVVCNDLERHQRTDVDRIISPSYGGTSLTPKAGFSGVIDISQFNTGNHKLRLEEVSRYGEVIGVHEITIHITNQKYEGRMGLESLTQTLYIFRPDFYKIPLIGWVVSNDAKSNLRVLVDGKVINCNFTRYKRKDVDMNISPDYGGASLSPNAAFIGQIDVSYLDVGVHKLRLEEVSRYGDVIVASEFDIKVSNKICGGEVCIDTPMNETSFIRPDETKIKVEGWAASSDAQASLRITIDGNVVANNLTRTERGDVYRVLPIYYNGRNTTPKAGFVSVIDVSHLQAGTHILKVEEFSRYGEFIAAHEKIIHIVNKKYQGEVCIDNPNHGKTFTKFNDTKMEVSGWAVSNDASADIRILLDGKVVSNSLNRMQRPDVDQIVSPSYGGVSMTPRAGFCHTIDIGNLGIGTHTIRVEEISRYGDLIAVTERSIVIQQPANQNSTNTAGAKGIDVSQFQGTIDWRSVAGSGVKFAMIRIGYRGYGTGGLVEDSKFRQNFAGAVANGLKVGVYFYSTAINTTEAKRDADYVVSLLRKYGYQNQVSMPIAIDLELVSGVNTRDKNVSRSMRTSIANTFGNTIKGYGYTPMVYACKSFLNSNMNASQISYDVWVAQYNSKCTYNGKYTVWQYTSTGRVPGIAGNVDCNICYKNY